MSPAKKPKPQAQRILDGLSAWISAEPGRKVVFSYTAEDGWTSTLVEAGERPSRGVTLADAAAQSAQTALCEVAP